MYRLIKQILADIHFFLLVEYVPYMRLGRRWLHLFLLSLNCKKLGKNLNFHYGVVVQGTKLTVFGSNIDIGRHSLLSFGGVECEIGNDVMMGSDVKLITIEHSYRNKSLPMRLQESVYSPIIIEDDVWLGDGVKVISGSRPLRISRGVIVGAGSVVTKNLDIENGIYAGIPAKFLKSRFD